MGRERIEDSVRHLYEALQRKRETETYLEAVKKKEYVSISNWMFSNLKKGIESFEIVLDDGASYYLNPKKIKVTRIRKKKIEWDLKKLKLCIGKKRFDKICEKQCTINNIDGLVAYLKTCGVDPKKFKNFVEVEKNINENILDAMLEKGEITETEIKGCYTVVVGEPYIKLTELRT